MVREGRLRKKRRERERAKGKGRERKGREEKGSLTSKVFGGEALNPSRVGKVEIVGLLYRIRIDRYIVQ